MTCFWAAKRLRFYYFESLPIFQRSDFRRWFQRCATHGTDRAWKVRKKWSVAVRGLQTIDDYPFSHNHGSVANYPINTILGVAFPFFMPHPYQWKQVAFALQADMIKFMLFRLGGSGIKPQKELASTSTNSSWIGFHYSSSRSLQV